MRGPAIPIALTLALVFALPAAAQPSRASELEALEQAAARAPGEYAPHLRLGIAFLDADRLTDAFIAFHKALAVRPEAAEPYFYLGLVYFRRGLFEQEVDAYREALSRDPDHLGARLNLGHALVATGDIRRAIEAYRSVLERDPGNLASLFNLGIIFAEANEGGIASAYLQRFLALAPAADPWRAVADSALQEVTP